jgi:hypothetical protein
MAATVIDSFVVELGLDVKNMDKGQQEAINRFKKTYDVGLKGARDIEDAAKRSSNSIGMLTGQVAGMFAIFTGGRGVVDFFRGMTNADAAVGRLSRNIGVSANEISRWQGVSRLFGGSAEEIASSFTAISDAVAGFAIGDIKPLIGEFRMLGAAGGTVVDTNKGVNQTLLDISANLSKINAQDPARAGLLGRRLGLPAGLYDLLIKGPKATQEMLDKVNALGPATKNSADEAGKLAQSWSSMVLSAEGLGRVILEKAAPSLSKFVTSLSEIMEGFREGKTLKGSLASKIFQAWGGSAEGNSYVPASGSITPSTGTPTSSGGAFSGSADKEAFIRAEAIKRGIDPNIAVAVAKSEGFNSYVGDRGSSFGAFQLHYGNVASGGMAVGGLGDTFTKQTGLDARNPATERAQIQFALDQAKQGGWGPWHGWRGSKFAGIGQGQGAGGGGQTTNIGSITVNTQATDAPGIAKDLGGAIKRQGEVGLSNSGLDG